jgi:hypothetical protein
VTPGGYASGLHKMRRIHAPATHASAALREPLQAWETLSRQPAEPANSKRSASAFLEEYEACFGQHPLLPSGQAAGGLPSRQVADYLNDLGQIS